jgi:hypothetical protein
MAQIRWIDFPAVGRLAIMPRPRADWLDDEIRGWRAQGVDIVVSLLDSEETKELGLGGGSLPAAWDRVHLVSNPPPWLARFAQGCDGPRPNGGERHR